MSQVDLPHSPALPQTAPEQDRALVLRDEIIRLTYQLDAPALATAPAMREAYVDEHAEAPASGGTTLGSEAEGEPVDPARLREESAAALARRRRGEGIPLESIRQRSAGWVSPT